MQVRGRFSILRRGGGLSTKLNEAQAAGNYRQPILSIVYLATESMFHPQGPTFWELARQALSSTERGYDLLAPKFDLTPFRTPDEVLSRVAACLAEFGPFESALDVCCGTGAAMQMLRPLCRERVVGLDMSRGMLEVAKRQVGGAPSPPRLEFVRGNALEMPFEGEFDLVVCFGALGHILRRDEPRFVGEIKRALRPGGRFVFVTGYLPSVFSSTYWLARGFNAAMRVRNALLRPPFIMYYLTFLLPGAQRLLEEQGFEVSVSAPFEAPFKALKLVVARVAG